MNNYKGKVQNGLVTQWGLGPGGEMMKKAGLLISAVLIVVSGCTTISSAPEKPLSFAVIGDLAYQPAFEPHLQRVLDEIYRTPLSFVVHLGDLAIPRFACHEELRAKRLAQFQASAHPLVFTPGDNDWADCHEAQGVKGGDPEERLSDLRARFFAGTNTLGKRTFAVMRQSDSGDRENARYRENVRWSQGGITFITLHLVGSNNNRDRTPEGDAEYAHRTQANIKWLREGFIRAKADKSRAVMIFTQANIFYENTPVGGGKEANPSGFAEIRGAVEQEALNYDRPVVFVHGDTHYFRIDKPLGRGTAKQRTPSLENFTRVEAFGYPNHHWLHVTVESDDPEVFTFRQRVVQQNVMERRGKP